MMHLPVASAHRPRVWIKLLTFAAEVVQSSAVVPCGAVDGQPEIGMVLDRLLLLPV